MSKSDHRSVTCRKAPAGCTSWIGTVGTLTTLTSLRFTPTSREVGFEVDIGDGWEFQATSPERSGFPPEHATLPSAVGPAQMAPADHPAANALGSASVNGRRAREKYDAEAFAADVDDAISQLRELVMREWKIAPKSEPQLRAGMSRDQAILAVCFALMMRHLSQASFAALFDIVAHKARAMLIEKNAAYGDSALNPVRMFSKASLKEQLLVRLDDKASRLARGSNAGEDVAADMLGYFLLVFIAEKREREDALHSQSP